MSELTGQEMMFTASELEEIAMVDKAILSGALKANEQLHATIARLRTALEDISKQHLTDEQEEIGDLQYGYDQIIMVARAALSEEQK